MLPYYTSLGFRSSVLTKVQQTHKLSSALGIGDCCQAVTRGEVILFASRIENWVIDTEVLPVLVIDASGNKLPVRGCISRTRGCSAFFAFAVLLFRSQRWSRDGSLTTNRGLSSFFLFELISWLRPETPSIEDSMYMQRQSGTGIFACNGCFSQSRQCGSVWYFHDI